MVQHPPPSGPVLPYRWFTVSLRHTTQDSSGRVISLTQRPLTYNTQHSQQTDIHAPGGIRTRNPCKRAAADRLLSFRGHWDRQNILLQFLFLLYCCSVIGLTSWSDCSAILQEEDVSKSLLSPFGDVNV